MGPEKSVQTDASNNTPRLALRYSKLTCACHVGQQMVFWDDGRTTIEAIPSYEANKENEGEDPEWLLKDKPEGYKTKFGH